MIKETVFVIDDDETTRDSLKMYLEFDGFAVDTCENSVDALDRIARQNFDVLLIDYRMPGMKGDELTARLRSLGNAAFIIGFSNESNEQAFLTAGADAFIGKHHLVQKLLTLIKNRKQCCIP